MPRVFASAFAPFATVTKNGLFNVLMTMTAFVLPAAPPLAAAAVSRLHAVSEETARARTATVAPARAILFTFDNSFVVYCRTDSRYRELSGGNDPWIWCGDFARRRSWALRAGLSAWETKGAHEMAHQL